MERIRALGLDGAIAEQLAAGTPVLGICVGMQVLFEGSVELGGAEGLGLLAGRVEALESPGLKVPHIGWSRVYWRRPSALTDGLPDACPFYHVHSFAPVAAHDEDVVGTASYGSEFVSVVERAPLYGVQFHPEKSANDGLALLRNFVSVCSARPLERAA
jgi:glutamine amidotransferase